MTEKLLHYIWQMKLWNRNLYTTTGEKILVLHAGQHNSNAGPDFLNCKVQIGDKTWAGHVELHLKTSDWYKHNHHRDENYKNVVLHVVAEHDQSVDDIMPVAEVKNAIDPMLEERFEFLMRNANWLPCEKMLPGVSRLVIQKQIERALLNRLESRVSSLINLLQSHSNSWEESFYSELAGSFGLHINADAFRMLASLLPLKVLARHKNNLPQLEALIFGTAGFLTSQPADEYQHSLQNEFIFLQKKYSLQTMPVHHWKFMRLRPAAFPTVRLAQFAAMVHVSSHLFSKLLESATVSEALSLFDCRHSDYWFTHYRFGISSAKREKPIGHSTRELILVNCAIPFLFCYGKLRHEEPYVLRAIDWLQNLRPESNRIIERWKTAGVDSNSAFDTQGLLEQYKNFCRNYQCLQCGIGHAVLNKRQALQN